LTEKSIPTIRAQVVAGAANNQLGTPADADRLRERGILYAPDYVINGAGLMNVAAELQPGGYDQSKVLRKVETIPQVLAEIFERADARGLSSEAVAEEVAKERLR
jgi:leucine dehydrogenase